MLCCVRQSGEWYDKGDIGMACRIRMAAAAFSLIVVLASVPTAEAAETAVSGNAAPPAVKAGDAVRSPADAKAPAVPKTAADSENGKNVAVAENKTQNHPSKTAEEKLPPLLEINGTPLSAADFVLKGVSPGDAAGDAVTALGNPVSSRQGALRTEYQWDGLLVTANSGFLHKYLTGGILTPDPEQQEQGVTDIYADKAGIRTVRGISVGERRENVLRVYGKPDQIQYDEIKKCFYLAYSWKDRMLVFTVCDGKVVSMLSGYADPSYLRTSEDAFRDAFELRLHPGFLPSRDFALAGYRIGQQFTEPDWDRWEKKMVNPNEEIWYFKDYILRIDTEKRINLIFFRGSRMMTPRGLAVGDQLSTLKELYGVPQRIDTDKTGPELMSVYYYTMPGSNTMLIMYVSSQDRTVHEIVLADKTVPLHGGKTASAGV